MEKLKIGILDRTIGKMNINPLLVSTIDMFTKTISQVAPSGLFVAAFWAFFSMLISPDSWGKTVWENPGKTLLVFLGVYCIYRMLYYPRKKAKIYAKRIEGTDIWVNSDHLDGNIIKPDDTNNTVVKMFNKAVKQYPDERCFGTRKVLRTTEEQQPNGKIFTKQERGEYEWMTFAEADEKINEYMVGLASLELEAGSQIAIYAGTCAEWMIAFFACLRMGYTVVTVYSTLGQDAISYAIGKGKCSVVFTEKALAHNIKELKDNGKLEHVKYVISFDDTTTSHEKDTTYFSPDQLLSSANPGPETVLEYEGPDPDHIAVIMYTSGSTGNPKGVMMTHLNLTTASMSLADATKITCDDVYIGYLPLAHVLELEAEFTVLSQGGCIGYSSPKTLTDVSPMIARGSKGDVTKLRPTIMAAVPAIMDKIRKGVEEQVSRQSSFVQRLFAFAFAQKADYLGYSYRSLVWDNLVFKKARMMLGGNVRAILSGGAPLSEDTQKFMSIVFSCPIGQGYGLTETCGGGTVAIPDDYHIGGVGIPINCCGIKLVPWGKYSPNNDIPSGEILLRGGHITAGYFGQIEKTKEEYVNGNDGFWFKTGDVGQIDSYGRLYIVDRTKDLVKLVHGEYVSPGKIESKLKAMDIVDNIMIHAESVKDHCLAIISVNHKKLVEIATDNGIQGSAEELCNNQTIIDSVVAAIAGEGKKAGLAKFEIPTQAILSPVEWTPESNLVTTALKLKRPKLREYYEDAINAVYV